MNYRQRIHQRILKIKNPICMGIDPVLECLPVKGSFTFVVESVYFSILEEMEKKQVFPAAIKPNMAFFEVYGAEGFLVLKKIIQAYQSQGVLVVLDAKRGDITSTSSAYAKMAFDYFNADAITLSPYMGFDTVEPFQKVASSQGMYLLVRTSNVSANDFQNLKTNGVPLYRKVAEKIVEWNQGDLGAVVGATAPTELQELLTFWKNEIPCLIPGISVAGQGQGGDFSQILKILKQDKDSIHLVNSSTGLIYSFKQYPELSYAEAIIQSLKKLTKEC